MSRLTELINLWPIWLPVVLGGVAIYGLLPRPRPVGLKQAAAVGLVALVAAGFLLVQVPSVFPEGVLFYAFSGLAIVAGSLLVTQVNAARAALSFVLVVLSSCGLFLLLAAPFLMAATIVVYAGAIIVIFLFVIMLAQQERLSDADARSREPLLATVTAAVLLFAMLYVLRGYRETRELDGLIARAREALGQETVDEMHAVVKDRDEDDPKDYLFRNAKDALTKVGRTDLYLHAEQAETEWIGFGGDPQMDKLEASRQALTGLVSVLAQARVPGPGMPSPVPRRPPEPNENAPALSRLSGVTPTTPPAEVRRNPETLLPELPAENSAYLGRSLFTDYLLPVEIGGLLLLVATVGSIAIAKRRAGQLARPWPASGTSGSPGRG